MCRTALDYKTAEGSTRRGTTGSSHSLMLVCAHICKKQNKFPIHLAYTLWARQQMCGYKFHLDLWSEAIFYVWRCPGIKNICKRKTKKMKRREKKKLLILSEIPWHLPLWPFVLVNSRLWRSHKQAIFKNRNTQLYFRGWILDHVLCDEKR